jgi:hypothetical protein
VSSITRIAKKMSVSLSGDCLSSLREAVARHHKASVTSERSVEDPSSDTEDCDDLATDKPSDSEDLPDGGSSPMPEVEAELAASSDESSTGAAGGLIPAENTRAENQPSVSVGPLPEINITEDSFVVLEAPVEEGVEALAAVAAAAAPVEPAMITGDGYTWSRQLVFRAKLTMHTAFERSDNSEPAAVTALAVSKDHRNLYVGDDRGRVFSWQVSNKPGKGDQFVISVKFGSVFLIILFLGFCDLRICIQFFYSYFPRTKGKNNIFSLQTNIFCVPNGKSNKCTGTGTYLNDGSRLTSFFI